MNFGLEQMRSAIDSKSQFWNSLNTQRFALATENGYEQQESHKWSFTPERIRNQIGIPESFGSSILFYKEDKKSLLGKEDKESVDPNNVDSYFYDLSKDNSDKVSDIEPEVSNEYNADHYKNILYQEKIAVLEEESKAISQQFKDLYHQHSKSKTPIAELKRSPEFIQILNDLRDVNQKIEKLKA